MPFYFFEICIHQIWLIMGKNTEDDERKFIRTDLINFLMFKSEFNIFLYIMCGSKGRRRKLCGL